MVMIKLRHYQVDAKSRIYDAWNAGYRSVLLRMPTGAGKTKTFCSIVEDTVVYSNQPLPTAIVVHRKELVSQICLTLAAEGIQHNIIASRKDIAGIIKIERSKFGKQFYNANSPVTVISVDTLISRKDIYKNWVLGVRQLIIDEAAHVLAANKWGQAALLFVNARILGVTATPERLDRKGLGSDNDGIFDVMVHGPETKWLIDNRYLSKYKIAIPPSDYTVHLESSSDTSDYSKQAMINASNQSQIVGDVVENYIKFANGKQAILFASDVGTAKRMEKQFLDRGIPAKSLDGTTPDLERLNGISDFESKKIKVLINVDLFDEGLDVPGIECVIMARPTKSLGKFLQMVGRGLRIAEGKEYMILIDHVGNVQYHKLPCMVRNWTLDRIVKGRKNLNFIRICSNVTCNSPYDRTMLKCPWCKTEAITATRSSESGGGRGLLQQVDGDLYLVDPETIRLLEAKAQLEDPGVIAQRVAAVAGTTAAIRAANNQEERIQTQKELAEVIAKWAGRMKIFRHYSDRQIHKQFFLQHDMTITEALSVPKAQMLNLMEEINRS